MESKLETDFAAVVLSLVRTLYFVQFPKMISCELGKKLSKSRSLMLTNGNTEDLLELELETVKGTGLCVVTTFNGGLFWLVVSLARMPVALLKVSEIDLFLAEVGFLATF